jgi:hypothetical protein
LPNAAVQTLSFTDHHFVFLVGGSSSANAGAPVNEYTGIRVVG